MMNDFLVLAFWSIVCLAMEAVFSGSEMALVSCDKLRLTHRANQGDRRARIALSLTRRPEWFFSTTLLGQNFFIVANSTLVTLFIFRHFGVEYEFWGLLLAPVILVFGEAVPKSVFHKRAEGLGLRMAPFILFFSYLFFPIVWLLSKLTLLLLGGVRGSIPTGHNITPESLEILLKSSETPRDLPAGIKRTMIKTLSFSRQRVHEIMTPLVDVASLRDTTSVKEALHFVREEGHSHVPLYQRRAHNIVGVLKVTDLLLSRSLTSSVGPLGAPPLYVPKRMGVKDLFILLKNQRRNFAVVVDEYGGAIGVVTLEDILEEIFGEIEDEFDVTEKYWTPLDHSRYLFRGRTPIDLINENFQWGLPKGNFETLSGFLVDRFGYIPRPEEKMQWGHLTFTVRAATPRFVDEILVEMG